MNSTSYKLAFSLFLNFTSAQIDGFIFDLEVNEPIQNVNISAGDLGTTSGSLGEFTLDVPLGTIIEFSHIGYETVKIKGRSGMSVNMQKKIIQSDEIIVNAGLIRERLRDKASSIFIATDEDIRDEGGINYLRQIIRSFDLRRVNDNVGAFRLMADLVKLDLSIVYIDYSLYSESYLKLAKF